MKCPNPQCGIDNNDSATECALCCQPLDGSPIKEEENLMSACCGKEIRYSKGSYMGQYHEACTSCGMYCNVSNPLNPF